MNRALKKHPEGESPRERILATARRLFGCKGFHPTTIAELASEARVSMGQLYRHFASKEAIIATIVEQDSKARMAQMHQIFDALERNQCTTFEAIKAIAEMQTENEDEDAALFYEILAEASRNPCMADFLRMLTEYFAEGMRRLAILAKPDAPASEIDSYVEVMMACFIGLGYRQLLSPVSNTERREQTIAHLMMRTLGLSVAPDNSGSC